MANVESIPDMKGTYGWNGFLKYMGKREIDDKLVFRAQFAKSTWGWSRGDKPVFIAQNYENTGPECVNESDWKSHDSDATRADKFFEWLRRHLNQAQEPYKSKFLSTSGRLDRTLHDAGRKAKVATAKTGIGGLAIFNVKAIQEKSEETLFSAAHIFDYLDAHDKGELISNTLRESAGNYREYVSLHFLPSDALVRWVPWEQLSNLELSKSFIHLEFWHHPKFEDFAQMHVPIELSKEEFAERVFAFAYLLAGQLETEEFLHLTDLIIDTGNWGWRGDWTPDEAKTLVRNFEIVRQAFAEGRRFLLADD